MKAYISNILSEYVFEGSLDEAKKYFDENGIRNELHRVLYAYYATKINNTYPKYAHCNASYRSAIMAKIDTLIYNKIESLIN